MGGRRLNWENVNKLRDCGPARPILEEIGDESKEWILSETVEELTDAEAVLYRQVNKYRAEISFCANRLNKVSRLISLETAKLKKCESALAQVAVTFARASQAAAAATSPKKAKAAQGFLANERSRLDKNTKGHKAAKEALEKLNTEQVELTARLKDAKEKLGPFQEAFERELHKNIRRTA